MAIEKIGLEGVLDLSDWNRGVSEYIGGIDKMDSAGARFVAGVTEEYSKLGGVITGVATAAVAAAATIATATAAALVDFTVDSVGRARDFESAFTGVIKTVDATEDELAGLRKGLLDMTSVVPTSATELAGFAEIAGQLGIDVANIEQFTRVVADLAVATPMAGEDAAMALARLANITGMAQTDFDRLGSSVVELGNNLATTESEIVNMALRIAGAGAQVGMSEAQILALAGALSSVGIRTEMGGSAISRVLIEMALAIDKGTKALEALEDTSDMSVEEIMDWEALARKLRDFADISGVTTDEFVRMFEQDASDALFVFLDGLNNVSEGGESLFGVLEQLEFSEIRVRDTLLRSSKANELYADALRMSTQAWDENIALTREAELRYGTLDSQFQLFENTIERLQIAVGDRFLPVVEEVLGSLNQLLSGRSQEIADLFGTLADYFGDVVTQAMPLIDTALPGIIDNLMLLAQWAADTAIAGMPLVEEWLPRLLEGITQVTDWLVEATKTGDLWNDALESMDPNLRSWVEGLLQVRDAMQEISGRISQFVDWLQEATQPLVDFIAEHVTLSDVVYAAAGAVALFLAPLGLAVAKMAAVGAAATLAVAAIRQAWEEDLGGVRTFLEGVFVDIQEFIGSALATIQELWTQHGERIAGDAREVWGTIVGYLSTAWDEITGLFRTVWPTIEEIFRKGLTVIELLWQGHHDTLGSTVQFIWENIQIIIEGALNAISGVLDVFIAVLEGDWAGAWDAAKAVIETVWDTIRTVIENTVEFIDGRIGDFLTVMETEWGEGWDVARALVETVWENIKVIIEGALEVISGLLDVFIALLEGDWAGAWEAAKGVVETIWETIQTVIENALEFVGGVIDGFLQTMEEEWGPGWEAAQIVVETVWGAIETVIQTALGVVEELIRAFLAVLEGDWEAAWAASQGAAETAWEGIQTVTKDALDALQRMFETEQGQAITTWLTSTFPESVGAAQGSLDRLKEAFVGLGPATEGALTQVSALWEAHKDTVIGIVDLLVADVIGKITTTLEQIALTAQAGMAIVSGDWEAAWALIGRISNASQEEMLRSAIRWSGAHVEVMEDAGGGGTRGFREGVEEGTPEAVRAIGDFGDAVQDEIRSNLGMRSPSQRFHEFGEGSMQGFTNGITQNIHLVVTAGSQAVDQFMAAFSQLASQAQGVMQSVMSAAQAAFNPSQFVSMGQGLVNGFISGIDSQIGQAQAKVAQLASLSAQAMSTELQMASPSRVFGRMGEWAAEGYIQEFSRRMEGFNQNIGGILSMSASSIDVSGLVNASMERMAVQSSAAMSSSVQSFATSNVSNQFGPISVSTPMDWAEMEFRIQRIMNRSI